jgi:molybdate transport system ATP-binding protein
MLARVTRRSWDQLQLSEGIEVFAQVKGVALAPGREAANNGDNDVARKINA